jgi:hypothetical protein
MAQLLEFVTATGDAVFVEVVTPAGMEPLAADGSDIIKKANRTLESALATIRNAASALLTEAGSISLPADTIELELGIKASAKAGFYLASADSEAQIKIKLVWNRTKKPPELHSPA